MVDIWCDLSRASIAQEPCEGTLTTTNCSILEHKSTLKRVWLTSASTVLLPKSAQTGPAEFNDRISCYDFTALSLNQIQLCFGNVSCAGLCFINRSIQWILAVTTRLLWGGEPEIIHPDGKGPGGFAGSKQWEGSTSLHAVRRCRSTAVPAEALVSLQGICRELWMCQSAPRIEAVVNTEQAGTQGSRMQLCLHSRQFKVPVSWTQPVFEVHQSWLCPPRASSSFRASSAVPGSAALCSADTLWVPHWHFQTTTSPRTKLYFSTSSCSSRSCLPLFAACGSLWQQAIAMLQVREGGWPQRQAGRQACCSTCFIAANAFHQQQQKKPSRSWVWGKVHNFYVFQHRLPGAGTFSV